MNVFNTIWERYFVKEFFKVFFLFILSFYGLYVMIDYSNHSTSFHHHHSQFQWGEFITHYFGEFVKRAEVLIPFALLITTIRTLCNLNVHNELVALMANGMSLQKLMRPFVLIGIFFTVLLYVNTQFFLPNSLKSLRSLHESHTRAKKQLSPQPIQYLILEDHTRFIFQYYDSTTESFFDSYWIPSIDDVYRIQNLFPNSNSTNIPSASFVEHLVRGQDGNLIQTESHITRLFPEIKFNKESLFNTITEIDEKSITELMEQMPEVKGELSEKESHLLTSLYYKLVMPWLCLLAVIGPAPYCLRFTRMLPVFYIYAFSIFGLVAFYLVMESAALIGEKQLFSPLLSIGIPFSAIFIFCLWKFIRLR